LKTISASPLVVLAVLFFAGCQQASPPAAEAFPPSKGAALVPSPRLLVGRVVAVDAAQGFAFVDLATDAPSAALAEGAALIARTLEFRETARLRSSRYVRGQTLGTRILSGQPSPGDEVVWLAP
jgi:hypothetical protein